MSADLGDDTTGESRVNVIELHDVERANGDVVVDSMTRYVLLSR